MTGRFPGARRRQRRAAAFIVASVVGGGASAQSASNGPDIVGFQAGGVMIAPSLTAGLSYNTNVLQQPEAANPEPDQVLTLQPALVLTVPFSNSSFRFGDVLTYTDYKRTSQDSGKTSNDAVADLTLNFGSRDQLELSAHNVAGVAQTVVFDLEGALAFQGHSFELHNEAVALSRVLQGARGYRLSLARNALRFDPSTSADFFNHRGFDGEAAYLQPLSSNTILSFGYLGSRYDHFSVQDPSTTVGAESGDTVYGQIDGQLGPRQPYSVRLGWQQLGFEDTEVGAADNFSGIVGQARLSAIVGGGTMFTIRAQRQPYRSYVGTNNYYLLDLVGGWVDRSFVRGSSVGGDLALAINSYNEPITQGCSTTPCYRQDRRVQVEAYGNLAIAKNVIFRVSLGKYRRRSNVQGADFDSTVLFGGFVLGWI